MQAFMLKTDSNDSSHCVNDNKQVAVIRAIHAMMNTSQNCCYDIRFHNDKQKHEILQDKSTIKDS